MSLGVSPVRGLLDPVITLIPLRVRTALRSTSRSTRSITSPGVRQPVASVTAIPLTAALRRGRGGLPRFRGRLSLLRAPRLPGPLPRLALDCPAKEPHLVVQIADLVTELPDVRPCRKVHEVPDPAGPSFHNTGHARLHLLDDDDGGRELGAVDELLDSRPERTLHSGERAEPQRITHRFLLALGSAAARALGTNAQHPATGPIYPEE